MEKLPNLIYKISSYFLAILLVVFLTVYVITGKNPEALGLYRFFTYCYLFAMSLSLIGGILEISSNAKIKR